MMLSILIPTVTVRRKHLNRLLDCLTNVEDYPEDKVEILIKEDTFEWTTGKKRNYLLSKAKGKFIVFIDDDDLVVPDYAQKMVEIIENNPTIDCIAYDCKYIHKQQPEESKRSVHRLGTKQWKDTKTKYLRGICHINPIKRSVLEGIEYPDKSWQEDYDFQKLYMPKLKKQYILDREMYIYNYDMDKTLSFPQWVNKNVQHQAIDWQMKPIREGLVTYI